MDILENGDLLHQFAKGRFNTPEGLEVDRTVWAQENWPIPHQEPRKPSASEFKWLRFDVGGAIASLRDVPDRVLWSELQTPVKNQKDRGTCSGFAIVAAIEARYKRDHGLDLNLSEQFFWHLFKSNSFDLNTGYRYENQSSMWGGGGSWGVRTAAEFVICEEQFAPYLSNGQMRQLRDSIPGTGELRWEADPAHNIITQDNVDAFEYSPRYISNAARNAARYGVQDYELLDPDETRDPATLERIIASGHEIILDMNLKWEAIDGVFHHSPESSGGAHSFLLVGYDKVQKFFYVKNSWGGDGLIRVAYDLVEKEASYGAYVTSVRTPDELVHGGRYVGRWGMDHDGWEGEAIIRRWAKPDGTVTRLGHYRVGNESKAINGKMSPDSQSIEFSIEDDADAQSGRMTGQRFDVSIFSRQVEVAAGSTRWKDKPYGVQLLRTPRHAAVAPDDNVFDKQDWVGTWDMNHDGWRGKLIIHRVYDVRGSMRPVAAEYIDHGGEQRPARGLLMEGVDHALHLEIRFPGHRQQFKLYLHTWDTVRFSGTTEWDRRQFGVIGVKAR